MGLDDGRQALVYETIIVPFARGILAPEIVPLEFIEVICWETG